MFEETLPKWVADYHGTEIAFLHLDCDLYVSTKIVFEHLGHLLGRGSIIVFDEYFNYPNWINHEFKAFKEFVEKNNIAYEYLAYAKEQVAIRILDRK